MREGGEERWERKGEVRKDINVCSLGAILVNS